MNRPVFDGHNDTLLHLWAEGDYAGDGFIHGMDADIDTIKARQGGFGGGFFAIFTPSLSQSDGDILNTDPITNSEAISATDAMMEILQSLTTSHPETITLATSADEIKAANAQNIMAAILHIEGAEAITPDLDNLDDYYRRGLRSIGLVWSRANAFGTGVNFDFPGTPDQGAGLTPAGIELVKACNSKKMLIDLSHLNEAGFWDVAKHSTAPLVATHSNCHELCPSPRNLTSRQLDAMAESGGLAGLNFAAGFLREDGEKNPDTNLEVMIRHLDLLLEHLGEDGVALGSDFDGAIIPDAIGSVAGLPRLIEAMEKAGYGQPLIEKITYDNWLKMIKTTIA